jgi:hypothetical protein
MRTMKEGMLHHLTLAAMLLGAGFAMAQEKAPAPNAQIDGVKGVKQEAVSSVKKVEPPTATPAAPSTTQGVNKVEGVNTVNGVKAATPEAVQPPPPPPAPAPAPTGSATKVGAGAVGAVSTIRAVQGVQGIIAPKQQNLEAALLIKQDGTGTPAGGGAEGGKGKAAAAALLTAPAGQVPAKPLPGADGRALLQEFEKQTTTGS